MASNDIVYAAFDFVPTDEDEIAFKAGDAIVVIERDEEFNDGWWTGHTLKAQANGVHRIGLFPANFISSTTTTKSPLIQYQQPNSIRPVLSSDPDSLPPVAGLSLTDTSSHQPSENNKNPNRRSIASSTSSSINVIDECESFITHLKESIRHSSIKLDHIRFPTAPLPELELVSENKSHSPIDANPVTSSLPKHSANFSPIIYPAGELRNGSLPVAAALCADVEYTPFSSTSSLPATEISSSCNAAHGASYQDPQLWTVAQVSDWIASIGFVTYADNFEKNEIDGRALLSLTLQSMKELDILALGKRIQIFNAILALEEEYAATKHSFTTNTMHQPTSSRPYHGDRNKSWSHNEIPILVTNTNGHGNIDYGNYYTSCTDVKEKQKHLHSNQIQQLAYSQSETQLLSPVYYTGDTDSNMPITTDLNGCLPFVDSPAAQPSPTTPISPLPCLVSPMANSGWVSPPFASAPIDGSSTSHPTDRSEGVYLEDLKPVDCMGMLKTLSDASGHAAIGSKNVYWTRRWMALKHNTLYWFGCEREKSEGKSMIDKPDYTRPALQSICINTGFKVTSDNSIKSGRFGIRLTELYSVTDPGSCRHWEFYMQDAATLRKWIRSLTKFTIFHPQHENSKHGTNGVQVIGNPRPLINRIRLSNGPVSMISSSFDLDHVPQNWTGTDLQSLHPHRGRIRSQLKEIRRPSLPLISSFATHAKRTIPLLNRLEYRRSMNPRSRSTDSCDRYNRPENSGSGVNPPQSTPVNELSPELTQRPISVWNQGTGLRGSSSVIQQPEPYYNVADCLAFINAYLPPNQHIYQINELISGVAFLAFLQEITKKSIPTHFSLAVRIPAEFPIDYLDNWDVVVAWIPSLHIRVPSSVSVEKLAAGHVECLLDLIESVRAQYAFQ